MQPFTKLTAIAAPIDEANVDTNQLCPTRFNKLPQGQFARAFFHELRFDLDGREKDFVLNREPYRRAKILVGGVNFGCGSSRETAVYGLYEYGFRCVIAPSFGDIFVKNCFKNGFLPVTLPEQDVAAIRRQLTEQPGANLTVDLESQTVTDATGHAHHFDMHPVRKRCLLKGLDDISRTREYARQIEAFETAYRSEHAWLFGAADKT